MENTHNKNTQSRYNSVVVVVVLLITSVAFCSPATRPTMIRNTKAEITNTKLCSTEELVCFNIEVEYKW